MHFLFPLVLSDILLQRRPRGAGPSVSQPLVVRWHANSKKGSPPQTTQTSKQKGFFFRSPAPKPGVALKIQTWAASCGNCCGCQVAPIWWPPGGAVGPPPLGAPHWNRRLHPNSPFQKRVSWNKCQRLLNPPHMYKSKNRQNGKLRVMA